MGSFERDLEDDLKYKYNGDRQKQGQDLARGVAEIEEQRKEVICKPIKDQLTKIQSRNRELERQLSEMAIEVVALTEENSAIKQAGTRLSNRIIDVLDNIIDESALLDALEKWEIAKEESE